MLDNAKHYWIGEDEVEKLLRHGEGWLAAHPEREQIARRYLKYRRSLASEALDRLVRRRNRTSTSTRRSKTFPIGERTSALATR